MSNYSYTINFDVEQKTKHGSGLWGDIATKLKKIAVQNRDLINHLFNQEGFVNVDQITTEDTYNNKMLFEQKVFEMLNPTNKKKYLNLTDAAKDMFLTKVSLTNI